MIVRLGSLLVAIAAGCGVAADATPDASDSAASEAGTLDAGDTGTPDGAKSEPEALADKLGLYAECLERTVGRVDETWSRYIERVGDDGHPKHKKIAPYLYEIDAELAPCERAVAEAPGMPPATLELDAAQVAYLDAARTFGDLTVRLHAYYESEGWTEDDWATSVELAPKMRDAHATWVQARTTLHEMLQAEQDRNDTAVLEAIVAREGKTLRWRVHDVQLHAKAFARCATAGDPGECRDASKELGAAHQAFLTAHDADPDASRVFWMSSYRATADTFVAAADAFVAAPAKKSAAMADEVHVAWARIERDFAHLDFDFPR